MNKREVVWLIVRLIGAYFCYTAIVAIFALVSSVWMIFSIPSPVADKDADPASHVAPGPMNEGRPAGIPGISEPTGRTSPEQPKRNAVVKADPEADAAKREIFKLIMWNLLLVLLQGGVGYYLLFHGGILFTLLNRENKPGELKEKEPESILLNLS